MLIDQYASDRFTSVSEVLGFLEISPTRSRQHAFKQGETQERCLEVTQDLQLQATSFEQDLSYATNQLAELNLEHQQLFQRLIASNNRLLEANERMSLELRQMRESVQLQLEIPPQVALQKPVTLLDACGSISPFHLDFINSVEAFLAVLKIRFQQQGINNAGIQMLENSQFILQDHKGVIDIFQPWQKVLRPNQRVNMSMRFRRNLPTRTCPACRHREDTLSGSLEW